MLDWFDSILFWINFAVGYVIPLLGTLYSRTCHEKWIFGWMVVLSCNYTLNPLLDYLLPYKWSQVAQITFNCWFSIAFTQDQALYLVRKMHDMTEKVANMIGLNEKTKKAIGIKGKIGIKRTVSISDKNKSE